MLAFILLFASQDVFAHVKWFTSYDLTEPPRPIFTILTGVHFLAIFLVAIPIMYFSGYADTYLARNPNRLAPILDRGNSWFAPQFFSVMQISVMCFFGALFYLEYKVILTPELKTNHHDSNWVQWLQLAIAFLVVHRKTAFLASIGIVTLYGVAIYRYGIFHLLDYPIFLGVAAYLFIISRHGDRHSALAINILRWFAGITLMWASIEKYAYPEWSFPLLDQKPVLTLGFSKELYMVAAGYIEFVAAFILVTGALASRVASAVLLVFFISAVPIFGEVDAVGHAVIIMVLICLILTPNPTSLPELLPNKSFAEIGKIKVRLFYVALIFFTALFYGGHWLAYGDAKKEAVAHQSHPH